MKAISFWARSHRAQAIIYLILLQTFLFTGCFFVGVFLFANDVIFPFEVSYIGAGLFMLACLLYPFKNIKKGWYKYSYTKAKSVQALVLVSSIILVCNVGNQLARSSMITSTDFHFEVRPVVLGPKKSMKEQKRASRKQKRLERKKLKKKLRKFIKDIRKEEKLTAGDIFLIVIIGAIFTLLFGWLVLGLYCSLACSGQVGLATTVLVLGTTLWIFGLIGLVRWIARVRRRDKAQSREKD